MDVVENDFDNTDHEMERFKGTKQLKKEGKQQNHERSFAELAEESRSLPEIRSTRLPMTMTEILRTPAKSKDWKTTLPKLPVGQVHLVKNSMKSDEIKKKEKRRKQERRDKKHTRRPPSPVPANSVSSEKEMAYKPTWKKRLHKRSNKRIVSSDNEKLDKLNAVSCELRLPALQEVRNVGNVDIL